MLAIAFAIFEAVSGSLAQVVGAVATERAPTTRVLMVTSTTALTAAVLLALQFGQSASWDSIGIGFLAGMAGAVGLPLSYRAFAIGPVGIVSPVVAATATITVVIGAWVGSGTIAPATAGGLVLCLLAVLIATGERSRAKTGLRVVLLALGAGLSFGAFTLLMSRVPGTEGLWPLAAARVGVAVVAVVLVAGALLANVRRPLTPGSPRSSSGVAWWALAVISGCCEILGNVLFLLALITGDLATVTVIQALSPVAAVLVGWPLLHQRPLSRHWIAVVISVIALAVIALGSL